MFEKEVTLLNEKGDTSIIKEEEKNIFNVLNAQVRELTVKEKKEYQIENGYILEKIINSPFARLGIRKGFIITSIDKNINISSEDLKNLSSKKGKVVTEGFYPNDYRRYYFILVL